MKRYACFTSSLLTLSLLGIASLGSANAAITMGTTPFTGLLTDFSSVGNHTLPYTDSNGRTTSKGGSILASTQSSSGLFYQGSSTSAVTGTITFSGLAAGTNQIGITFGNASGAYTLDSGKYLASIAFDNGNSLIVGPSTTGGFLSFTDTTPFTSATITLSLTRGNSGYILDFRTAGDPVPEPASFGLLAFALIVLTAGAVRWRRA